MTRGDVEEASAPSTAVRRRRWRGPSSGPLRRRPSPSWTPAAEVVKEALFNIAENVEPLMEIPKGGDWVGTVHQSNLACCMCLPQPARRVLARSVLHSIIPPLSLVVPPLLPPPPWCSLRFSSAPSSASFLLLLLLPRSGRAN